MYIDIDTNLIVCFIIMFFYGLLMEIALYRHMKKQELLINNEKTRKKDSIDFKQIIVKGAITCLFTRYSPFNYNVNV